MDLDISLLHSPLLSSSRGPMSLAGLLRELATGDELELLGLQSHQSHAVHAFLVQLAALAIRRTASEELARPEDEWRQLLLDLTGGVDEAWQLVVDDPSKPAFLQPPAPEGDLSAYKRVEPSPQGIDVLVLAKNHDIKLQRDLAARPEHWVYTLISLQTMEGFSGRGNYGVARMNSGFGNRPGLGYAPDAGWPARFRRDVRTLIENRTRHDWSLHGFSPRSEGLIELLWLLPWDGSGSMNLARLDPWFLEVCRRVRLTRDARGGLEARLAATTAPRVEAKHLKGDLGDAWMPVRKNDAAAMTVGEAGLTYRLLADVILLGSYDPCAALQLRDEDGDAPVLIAQVLVRGQGQTNGYHQRRIPIAEDVLPLLQSYEGSAALGELAKNRIERVDEAQKRVLRPAICVLLQGAPDKPRFNDPRARPHVDRLDREIDRVFFGRLWRDVRLEEAEQLRRWHDEILDKCRRIFEDAVRALPVPETRRYRAIAGAESVLFGGARKVLHAATCFDSSDQKGDAA